MCVVCCGYMDGFYILFTNVARNAMNIALNIQANL